MLRVPTVVEDCVGNCDSADISGPERVEELGASCAELGDSVECV